MLLQVCEESELFINAFVKEGIHNLLMNQCHVATFANCNLYVVLSQSSVLLLILSEIACTLEVSGEDQVVAAEVLNMSPLQMGNIKVSDLLAGLLQGKKKFFTKHFSGFRWDANRCTVYKMI